MIYSLWFSHTNQFLAVRFTRLFIRLFTVKLRFQRHSNLLHFKVLNGFLMYLLFHIETSSIFFSFYDEVKNESICLRYTILCLWREKVAKENNVDGIVHSYGLREFEWWLLSLLDSKPTVTCMHVACGCYECLWNTLFARKLSLSGTLYMNRCLGDREVKMQDCLSMRGVYLWKFISFTCS